jgi:hypothetical protein
MATSSPSLNGSPEIPEFLDGPLWRGASDFEEQIGRYIDDTRPPMVFEAARRRRVLIAPEPWRMGGTGLSISAHEQVH